MRYGKHSTVQGNTLLYQFYAPVTIMCAKINESWYLLVLIHLETAGNISHERKR